VVIGTVGEHRVRPSPGTTATAADGRRSLAARISRPFNGACADSPEP
jgi:hypothetical protein